MSKVFEEILKQNLELKQELQKVMLEVQDAGYQAVRVSEEETKERLLKLARGMEDMLVRMDESEKEIDR